MSSSLQFVVHPLPGSEEQFNDRLKEVAERINRFGQTTHAAFANLRTAIKRIVLGPTHIGLLLEDGRICRVAFSVISDRLDLSKNDPVKSSGNGGGGGGGSGSNGGSGGGGNKPPGSGRQIRTRARLMRSSNTAIRGSGHGGTRGAPVIIGTSAGSSSGRPMVTVPAPYVPEELVSQAQVVLQGKSRNLIIRELQRTNLDVNLAVNNLLSRDDEEGEEGDDAADSYVPEDLISLLDGGFHSDHSVIIDADAMFSEDMFGYSGIRNFLNSRGNSNRGRVTDRDAPPANSAALDRERENFSRWRDRQYFGPRRWLENTLRDSNYEKDSDTKKKDTASPLWISDEIEFWPESVGKFVQVAALYSELIALSNTGQVYQWRWNDLEPFKHPENPNIHHPKITSLGLLGEKIQHLSACVTRCTVATESGKVATWLDELLAPAAQKVEHSAQAYTEFQTDRIATLHTCTLYTVARLESGALYWWGVLPFAQRKRLWEKYRAKCRKQRPSTNQSEVVTGSQVCMKNSPMYHPGAIACTIANGVPKVGQLQNSAWSLSDTCTFKIINVQSCSSTSTERSRESATPGTSGLANNPSKNPNKETADRLDMPPPPSPASSTCSDTGSITNSHKRQKRMTVSGTDLTSESRKDEEEWLLRDVVFVEDVRSVPIGKVLKVDGAYAAVRFPTAHTKDKETKEADDIFQDCRLLRKDDLQVLKSSSTSRVPDCFQRTPRKVQISDSSGQILTISVDVQGIHAIVRTGNKLSYVIYNVSSGRAEQDNPFPSDTASFMGLYPQHISLSCPGESIDSVLLLRDGNSTIYPLAKDCAEAIRDPLSLDLPPVKCVGTGTVSLSGTGQNMKNQVAVVVLALEEQLLMPKILRCDIEGTRQILLLLENDSGAIQRVLNERCDGNRNIFHAVVNMCTPTSNKETETETTTAPAAAPVTTTNSGLECINVITNALGPRSVSLREMMRRAIRHERDANNSNVVDPQPFVQEESIPTHNWPPETFDVTSGDEDSLLGSLTGNIASRGAAAQSTTTITVDPTERRNNAIQNLHALLYESTALTSHLVELLCAKDAQGQTPFMLAVSSRCYPAALEIFERITQLGSIQEQKEMIFPKGSSADHSPLHVLCCNDTCSFTWTGAEHINQDIFECKTCGLTGTLCCCTECARVCHKGHDCKLKRTSPTAYCDCWEKCKCKALIMGNQSVRLELLTRLVKETNLVELPNSRGESILLFLAQTAGRQNQEQRQYRAQRPRTASASSRNKTPSSDIEPDMPDHDLEPPRFSRRALECLLGDWKAVCSMIMSGFKEDNASLSDQPYLSQQSGTNLLDKFTHYLLVKCHIEVLEMLIDTLVREMKKTNKEEREMAIKVARRFVRSVVRIFVIFSVEMAPNSSKKRNFNGYNIPINKCRRVFRAMMRVSIEELCEIADSLIVPVRLGVARPTAPFSLATSGSEIINGSEELFLVDPLAPLGMRTAVNSSVSEPMPYLAEAFRRVAAVSRELDDTNDTESMAIDNDDDNASEHEEAADREIPITVRQSSLNEGDAAEAPPDQQEAGAGQGEDSDPELDLLAETESDSDDNHSNQDAASAQRSVQTGATAGSDTGMLLFPEDESDESTQQEEEESEAGETDEQDTEDYPMNEEQLERRRSRYSNATGHGQRSNLAPQNMQWAIRGREVSRSAGVRLGGGSNLVFIDPTSLRRSTTGTTAVAAGSEPVTMATTASCLARAFGIVIRQISDLLSLLHLLPAPTPHIEVTQDDICNVQIYLEFRLKPTWDWLLTVMDATEAQLRFGASLTHSSDPANPAHPLHSAVSIGGVNSNTSNRSRTTHIVTNGPNNSNTSRLVTFPTSVDSGRSRPERESVDAHSSRREFLSYCLSLMRAHNSEHLDSLPILDVSSLKHVAYVFDALIYFMRSGISEVVESDGLRESLPYSSWTDQDENENEEGEEDFPVAIETESLDEQDISNLGNLSNNLNSSVNAANSGKGRKHSFFQRSESTLCLGSLPPDPFESPMSEALPLADQPHLLQPSARREDLFGIPKQPITLPPTSANSKNKLGSLPTHLGLSNRTSDYALMHPAQANQPISSSLNVMGPNPLFYPQNYNVVDQESELDQQADLDRNDDSMQVDVGSVASCLQNASESLPNTSSHSPSFSGTCSNSGSQTASNSGGGGSGGKTARDYSNFQSLLAAVHSESSAANEDHPQDLSCNKDLALGTPSNYGQDHDYNSDSDMSHIRVDVPSLGVGATGAYPNISGASTEQSLPASRPQIIVSPRKSTGDMPATGAAVGLSMPTLNSDLNQDYGGLGAVPNSSGTPASSRSPTKSVIVRAGSSLSNSQERKIDDVEMISIDNQQPETLENQEISANVTVVTTPNPKLIVPRPSIGQSISHDLLLGRWRLSLDLFGRVFMEDVGLEPGSVVSELGGFPVKEAKFRRDMEKLRNNQQRDLSLSKMERDRTQLILQTFKELNTQYNNNNRRASTTQPPLAVNRVKVTFKDEPGEGSGVARSFYTAIAEAILANEKLPNLESAQVGNGKYAHYSVLQRLRRDREFMRRAAPSRGTGSSRNSRDHHRRGMNEIRPFVPAESSVSPENQSMPDLSSANSSSISQSNSNRSEHISSNQQQINDRLYPKVYNLHPTFAGRIAERSSSRKGTVRCNPSDNTSIPDESSTDEEDNAPLFYCPGKRGFYAPRQGKASFERLNAFRNVGRLLGLCLLQNELCPIFLTRHVLKSILGRPIRFHDLAFFDQVIYESMRQLVVDSETKENSNLFSQLDLNFSIDLTQEEGGGNIDLVPGGRDIEVNASNVYDYVRKYAMFKMVKAQEKAIENIRLGVFDVLPDGSLDGLTAEDLRLLLNGVGDINVSVLISYTSFNDESGENSERLIKFKRWLWSIVEKMTHVERQDLVYFWTGSPALPASEDGFQPMPSVTIRPADDTHLPTANTCISRLYIPLYSSRTVLRQKLLLAIKTKNFGFV